MPDHPTALADLVAFWDFQEPAGMPRRARGVVTAELHENHGLLARVEGGCFGPYAMRIHAGQWLHVPRAQLGGLDIHGPQAQVTVVAWLKRERQPAAWCDAIAGVWNEGRQQRQYALFVALGLRGVASNQQVCGHISGSGGPSPGERFCDEAAAGATAMPFDTWCCIAMSYDGRHIRAWLDGRLDRREVRNPFPYAGGIHAGGSGGADFTVGAVFLRTGQPETWCDAVSGMGNWFQGTIGGLAVYRRALAETELMDLAGHLPRSR